MVGRPDPGENGLTGRRHLPPGRYRGPMRKKRTRARPRAPDRDKPPDATGLTIDWIGVQATGSGGATVIPTWIVGGLMALRAAPFLVWKVSRRLFRARRGGGRAGESRDRS
jgi:hypothetical protein